MKGDGWVLVRSEDELRVGLLVQIRPCGYCNRSEIFVLTNPEQVTSDVSFCMPDGTSVAGSGETVWILQPTPPCGPRPVCFDKAIRERRLYRLAEDPPAETASESAKTPARKPVTVR